MAEGTRTWNASSITAYAKTASTPNFTSKTANLTPTLDVTLGNFKVTSTQNSNSIITLQTLSGEVTLSGIVEVYVLYQPINVRNIVKIKINTIPQVINTGMDQNIRFYRFFFVNESTHEPLQINVVGYGNLNTITMRT